MKSFEALKKSCIDVIRSNEQTCKQGYADLLRAENDSQLISVIRFYWSDLNRMLWPQFQELLVKYYDLWADEFRLENIYYNESAIGGLCCVDDNAGLNLSFGGTARVIVHGKASVTVFGSAHATIFDRGRVDCSGMTNVILYGHSVAHAYGQCNVHAYNDSVLYTFGPTHIFAHDFSHIYVNKVLELKADTDAIIDYVPSNIK